jgi:YggT family protein
MVVFDTASSIALFLNIFVSVYLLAIFLYIILSWIRLPYSLQPVQRFLYDVCEPYLALWRRLLPFLRVGPLDLTPMIAILALLLASRVVIALLD